MKKVYPILVSLLCIVVACSNDDDDSNNSIELSGTYIYEIPACDTSGNLDMSCIDFMTFREDFKVDILIGGGDIISTTSYTVNDDVITLDRTDIGNFDVSFKIVDESTLERLEEDEFWLKIEEFKPNALVFDEN